MPDPGHTAIGTWSGGRFMHFGEALDDERLVALLRPDDRIRTVLTADVYGCGDADRLLGRALAGLDRDAYCLVGAVGHDFYTGAREGAKGFPRFTDPRLRGPSKYGAYTREAVWEGMAALRDAGLTRLIGVAPGPANGFTLDVIDCFERFGSVIDCAMLILNPFEPWPGELAPIAQGQGLRLLRLACQWNLPHPGVASVVSTLIQDSWEGAKPVEAQR